jgi:4-alpha-glucanotransferase
VPGSPNGNWRWRFTEDMLSSSVFERLQKLIRSSKR